MKKKIDLLEERSDYAKEIFEKTPTWIIRWGNSMFLLFIIVILFLSYIVKYPDTVESEVEITTNNPPISIASKSSGKLMQLFTNDNQAVHNGEWLAVIENAANTNDIIKVNAFLKNFKIDSVNDIPVNLNLGNYQANYIDLIKNVILYNSFKLHNLQITNISSNKIRLTKFKNVQSDYSTQKEIARKEFELKQQDYQRYLSLYNSKVMTKSELESKEIELLQAENNYKNFNTLMSNLENDKGLVYKDISQLTIDKKNQEIELITNIKNSIQALKMSLLDWEDKFLLKSPISGKIVFFEIWKQNQLVTSSKVLFSIQPIVNKDYFVRIKIPINNSGKVKIGQNVIIKLSSYPFEEFGIIEATIKSVSTIANDNSLYAEGALKNGLYTNYGNKIQAVNLTGTGEIITKDMRLIERFFYTLIKNIKKY